MKPAIKRCAIYTRKSSEEGLDQTFNSLDAQREAGEAYIKSQSHEGWTVVRTAYDDGGFSGGTMERPGLKELLADVAAGMIDVVVVYKIDRLTRSLSDFSRIVEIFEQAGTSFVSVTQSFNTTDSMGRLMLNVLLSFAQFEREVTGERIRDKIAASKAKGMWMGGTLPLGYDRPAPNTHKLIINHSEAETVRHIFDRYLELGSVHQLQRELDEHGILSKLWVTLSGKRVGGLPFSRGALFHLLRNRTYLGMIVHKRLVHDGEHEGIVNEALFEQVQQQLHKYARRRQGAADNKVVKAPLTGKLFDANGEPMSPSHSRGRGGRVYRYYVSASLQQGNGHTDEGTVQRLPAPAFEKTIGELVKRWLPKETRQLAMVQSIRLGTGSLTVSLDGDRGDSLSARLDAGETILQATRKMTSIRAPFAFPMRGGRRIILPANRQAAEPDLTMISALRRAHRMIKRERGLPTMTSSPKVPYDRMILMLAFLAPDIQRAILAGKQPPLLNLERLTRKSIPLGWHEQRKLLGWPVEQKACSAEQMPC